VFYLSFAKNVLNIFGKTYANIFFLLEEGVHLSNSYSWNWCNLSTFLKIFGIPHFVECINKLFELICYKLMSKSVSLIVFPNLGNAFDKIVGIIFFNNVINLWLDLLFNIIFKVLSDLMINAGSFFNSWFWSGDRKIINKTKLK
jgi:hypothetical protein